MQRNQRKIRIIVRDATHEAQPPSMLAKVLAFVLSVAALVIAFMISVVALAIVSVVIVIGVGYVWWRTRDLRRQLRENPPGGRVIDGDAYRDQD
ncbi:MAG: hypothetical protein OER43_08760 [Gammaproteobacteria bacterium]|nr:hypothetical protein [Gammaproteobacteria bacterium]